MLETFTHQTWLKVVKFGRERSRKQAGKLQTEETEWVPKHLISLGSHSQGSPGDAGSSYESPTKSCSFPAASHKPSCREISVAIQAPTGSKFLPHIKLVCSLSIRGIFTKASTHLNKIKPGPILFPSLFCFLVRGYLRADRKAHSVACLRDQPHFPNFQTKRSCETKTPVLSEKGEKQQSCKRRQSKALEGM